MVTDTKQVRAPEHKGLFEKPAAAAAPAFEAAVKKLVASLTGKVNLIEERTDSMRERIELVEKSMVEKHKTSIKEIGELRDEMRTLRGDVLETKALIERVAGRLDAFASNEEVAVLKRYVELWQPMTYVTRSEVKSIVKSMLKGEESKEEE